MRAALAAMLLMMAACESAPETGESTLFSGTADLPIIAGGQVHDCPNAVPFPEGHSNERICLLLAKESDPERARDYYRRHMIHVARWVRARSDETSADVWIFPGTPTTRCLTVSAYRTVESQVFAELTMSTLSSNVDSLDACDWALF